MGVLSGMPGMLPNPSAHVGIFYSLKSKEIMSFLHFLSDAEVSNKLRETATIAFPNKFGSA